MMTSPTTPFTVRLTALDAFRGGVILLMVLVNDGGGPRSYRQLEHSPWHGWTLTDTVFPSFLWIVGVAITLSLSKRLDAVRLPSRLLPQIARRAALLFGIGVLLYLLPSFDLSHARILGVLQRIALCYLAAACLFLYTGVRAQLAVLAGLLVLYAALMTLYPVPGFGAGRFDMQGNFAHYVDAMVLGPHNYPSTKTWDPEGIVSTLPAIGSALLGVMAGHILGLKIDLQRRIGWLAVAGGVLVAAAMIWSVWMPINKKIWTCPFALLMAGFDFVVLAVLLWFVDERGHKDAVKPLVIVGLNSIAIYVASEVLAGALDWFSVSGGGRKVSLHELIYGSIFAPLGSVENASLAWAVSFTLLMYLLAYGLYKKSWFWRI